MGLLKSKNIKGYDAEYHRIISMAMHYDRLDCVINVALYKNLTIRDEDETAVVHTFSIDLGSYFHEENYTNGEDIMKNVSLKTAYRALDAMSKAEEAKRDTLEEGESINEDLAFFHDATGV